MERLYDEYRKKGVEFLHCLSGEAARTAIDFQKHYRSRFPHLIDPLRRFEKKHNPNGWPFYMVVDRRGTVVFAEATGLSQEKTAEIRGVLDQVATGKPIRTGEFDGTLYAEKTLKANRAVRSARESFPCLVADRKGALFLSYATVEDGRSVVRLRHAGGEVTVSEGRKDAYYSVLAVDGKNRKWIFYTGQAPSGRYDVFARRLGGDGVLSAPENLTASDDDAMHPAATVDTDGNVWVAYYRWRKMGAWSRDKEIYARAFDGRTWLPEMRLSPDDLPSYEDHTDPAIAPGPRGGVAVAWSWDMHPLDAEKYKRYQSEFGAMNPSIFGRRAAVGHGPGYLLFLGAAGLDGTPELRLASGGRLWCAWHALAYERSVPYKGLFASVCEENANDRATQTLIEKGAWDICTPRFHEREGAFGLVWSSQDRRGRWRLKQSVLSNGKWSPPRVIEEKGNPRFPSLARDGEGRLHVAFVRDEGGDRKIVRRPLDTE